MKELGAVVSDCRLLAQDLKKVFEVYWKVGEANKVPSIWPSNFSTEYNFLNPLPMNLNASAGQVFISSSPGPLSPLGRSDDLKSIVAAIDAATKFVYVAVMDFSPQILYDPRNRGKLWTPLDEALRRAAVERNVDVRLLVSEWPSTRKTMKAFAASLNELGREFSIRARKFVVPPAPHNHSIPFTRVNHNKYMVTDLEAYIGTSNWSGDYFIDTAGVGLNILHKESVAKLKAVFLRDWNSQFTHEIYDD